jgi:hypothetical protein
MSRLLKKKAAAKAAPKEGFHDIYRPFLQFMIH